MQFKGDFNINRKTASRVVAVFIFIIALAIARINTGYTIVGILLSIGIIAFETRFLNQKASAEPAVIYSKRQKTFTVVGFLVIAALFIFIGIMAYLTR